MAGEYSSGGRQGIFGALPLWLLILLAVSAILAVLALAALAFTFITRSDSSAVPTLIPTAEVPTRLQGGAVSPTEEPDRLPPTNTIVAGELVPTYTPISYSTPTATPDQTNTPRPTWTSTSTRPPLPTSTRYIPKPPPATATLVSTPLPQVTATSAPASTWRGEYFNNQELAGDPTLVRQDPQINFQWGGGSPAEGIPADHFSVRWTRTVFFNAGTYTFNVFPDDGARVWLDNQLIINEWHDTSNSTYRVSRSLTEGNHAIRVEYFENQGDAHINFWWESGTEFPQWRGEYFTNQNLSGTPVMVRNDFEIKFDWGSGSPANVIPSDHFSVRWSRDLGFNAGDYMFSARTDDGIRVRLDGQLIIDQWHDFDGTETYTAFRSLSSGVHSLQVEYFENLGDAFVEFSWEPATTEPFWNGQYFANMELSGSPTLTRSDASVNFFWGLGSPASNIPSDGFSVRWDRVVNFGKGTYRFYSSVDDGIRVYIDGKILIDGWTQGGKQQLSADVSLSSGFYQLVIEYFEYTQVADVHVWWEKIGG